MDFGTDAGAISIEQLRIDRQCQDFAGGAFDDRERPSNNPNPRSESAGWRCSGTG
jgi:hypothetical protein